MKIRYPVIVFITLFIMMQVVGRTLGAGTISLVVSLLLVSSLLWLAYAIIAKICRTIYHAIKSKANQPEKEPLEP